MNSEPDYSSSDTPEDIMAVLSEIEQSLSSDWDEFDCKWDGLYNTSIAIQFLPDGKIYRVDVEEIDNQEDLFYRGTERYVPRRLAPQASLETERLFLERKIRHQKLDHQKDVEIYKLKIWIVRRWLTDYAPYKLKVGVSLYEILDTSDVAFLYRIKEQLQKKD